MAQHGGAEAAAQERAHPTPLKYVAIALILAVVTIVEVAVAYLDVLYPMLVPILVVLSALKFVLVVSFFMHLRFDSRLFSAFFVTGLLLATAIIVALIVLFRVGA